MPADPPGYHTAQYPNNLGRWAMHLKRFQRIPGLVWFEISPRTGTDRPWLPPAAKSLGKGLCFGSGRPPSFGFRQLNLPVISACAHIENIASIHILEKIGMEYTGEGIVDECPVKNFVKNNPYT